MIWVRTLFVCLLLCPLFSGAQISDSLPGNLTIKLNPAYPAPGEQVTATLDDYSLGLTGASITWTFNNQKITSTDNERSVVFVAGAVGTTDTLMVEVRANNNSPLSATTRITPIYTDIIIEPQTFVPQFYAGRALPTHESIVRATALVSNGKGVINPSEYTYVWKLEGSVLGGGGKKGGFQTFYEVPLGRDHVLSLDVLDAQGQTITKRVVAVKAGQVDVRLYEASPLYGLSSRSLSGTVPFIGNTLTLRAMPFNLDLRANASNLLREWRINNTLSNTTAGDPYEITLERTGLGLATVNFKIHHREALLQQDSAAIQLQF
ncbi:MAG: hypothetical protein RLZZ70_163 [Candidatus Parcubacteria bacterium]|jgi:hypothetical protein